MTNSIAELGLNVNSSQVKTAERNLNKFTDAGNKSEKTTKRVKKATDALGGSMSLLKKQVVGATVAFVSFQTVQKSTNLALNFGAAISEVETLTGSAGGVIQKVAKDARDLAIQFGTFPKEQVAAFYQAFSSGAKNAASATALLTAANVLAVAGVSDVATSVQILSSIVNAYGSEVITVTDVSDILFTGVKVGVTNLTLLSSAIGTVIPFSNALGISFSDTVATIAAMTTQSMTTSQATTALAAALSSLAKPTEEAKKLAKDLKFEFNEGGLAALGLKGFLEGVIEATGGSASKMAILFGSIEATKGVLALAGEGAQKLTDSFIEMEKRVGATSVAFGIMSKDELFRLNRSISFFRDKLLSLGQVFASVLVPALEVVVQNFNTLAGVATVLATVVAVRLAVSLGVTLVTAAASAITSTIALEIALGATSTAAALASGATKLFSASLVFLKGALIATGIGALIVGAGYLVGKFFDLVGAAGSFGGAVKIVGDVAKEAFGVMITKGKSLVVSWKIWMNDISFAFTTWSGNMKATFFGMIDSFNTSLNSTFSLDLDTDNAEKSIDSTTAKMTQLTDELVVLIDEQNKLEVSLNEPMEAWKELTDLLAKNKDETDGNSTAIQDMLDKLKKLGKDGPNDLGKVAKATDKATKAADALKGSIGEVGDAWGDFVVRGFKDFKGFVSSVLDSFKRMLSEMIATAASNKILISLGVGGSGIGRAASASTGGGGGGGLLSNLLGGSGIASSFLGTGAATGALGLPAMFTGGGALGTISGALAGGAAGTGFLGSIGGFLSGGISSAAGGITGGLATGGLAGLAGALGAAVPIIGEVFAVISVAKTLFGRKLKDTGLQGTFDFLEGLQAQQFKFFKGGLFRSNKTVLTDLEEEVRGPIEDSFVSMANSVVVLSDALGIATDFSGFKFDFKFSTAGLSQEKVQEKFQELILSMGDSMAAMVEGLDDFSQLGENSLETLQRLGGSLILVNDTLSLFGFTIKEVSLVGADAASTFVDFFGGVESFTKSTSSFYANFFTQAEQVERATNSMTGALAILGIDALPRSKRAFRDLVENALAEGDDSLAASLILLSDSFSGLIDTTRSAAAATDELNRAESIYATRQEEVFVKSGLLGGFSQQGPTTRTDDVETQQLLRELLTAVKTGNINISTNTAKTAQLLQRIELTPV